MKPTTDNQNLSSTLSFVGLSKKEAKIYLAGLELGPSSVWDIAELSGVKRSTCYEILEDLSVQSIASYIHDGKRTIYSMISPKQLIHVVDRHNRRLHDSLSQLEAVALKSNIKPKVTLFDGVEGIKHIYNMSLDLPRGSKFFIINTILIGNSKFTEFINEEYIPARAKKGIETHALFPDDFSGEEINSSSQKHKRYVKYLPKNKFNFSTQVCIFGNSIAHIAFQGDRPFATVIESKAIADDTKQLFELLWEVAKKRQTKPPPG